MFHLFQKFLIDMSMLLHALHKIYSFFFPPQFLPSLFPSFIFPCNFALLHTFIIFFCIHISNIQIADEKRVVNAQIDLCSFVHSSCKCVSVLDAFKMETIQNEQYSVRSIVFLLFAFLL